MDELVPDNQRTKGNRPTWREAKAIYSALNHEFLCLADPLMADPDARQKPPRARLPANEMDEWIDNWRHSSHQHLTAALVMPPLACIARKFCSVPAHLAWYFPAS